MAVLNVLHYPNKRLRIKATPVEKVDTEIKEIVQDMFDTMYAENGAGIAATQVDIHKRIFILDLRSEAKDIGPVVFINPEIIETEGEIISTEGCLSFPGVTVKVKRARRVKVKYLDIDGKEQIAEYDNNDGHRMAIGVQHEIEHIDGKVFIDKFSPLKQKIVLKKLKKIT